jgi:hypothetical protein
MTCPLCEQRKGKRQCPAVGASICPVCCGTKRLVEIRCPESCPYLAEAKRHPPAVRQRQQQQDVSMLLPLMRDLTDRQSRFFLLFQSLTLGHQSDPLQPLTDGDLADAAAALAATLETAAKGVIYEQTPQSLPAQRLAAQMRSAFEEIAREGPRSPLERDAAKALRAVETGARTLGTAVGDAKVGYLALLGRVLPPPGAAATAGHTSGSEPSQGSSIILPP